MEMHVITGSVTFLLLIRMDAFISYVLKNYDRPVRLVSPASVRIFEQHSSVRADESGRAV
jgi:hypothetical protein